MPAVVLVGPAAETHTFPKLSDGVNVTPAWDEAKSTSKSPPVLWNSAVGWVVCRKGLMYPCSARTIGADVPAIVVRLPVADGSGNPAVIAVAPFGKRPN